MVDLPKRGKRAVPGWPCRSQILGPPSGDERGRSGDERGRSGDAEIGAETTEIGAMRTESRADLFA
jgi:hypothetical protein